MKLIYKIDKKYDKEMLFEFMPKGGARDLGQFAGLMRIDKDEAALAIKNQGKDIKKLVPYLVEQKYKKILPYLKNSVATYQSSWNKINKQFSELVAAKTQSDWKHKIYYCVVSAYHEGISSWGGNTIARHWSINPDTQRPVTAHELTLSHFWSIMDENEKTKEWTDDKKWQYSEILSWCLLGLDDDFYKFWPWLPQSHRFPLNHNYPDIVPLQKKLRTIYLKHKDFKSFLEQIFK